jgi:hypothetical protein
VREIEGCYAGSGVEVLEEGVEVGDVVTWIDEVSGYFECSRRWEELPSVTMTRVPNNKFRTSSRYVVLLTYETPGKHVKSGSVCGWCSVRCCPIEMLDGNLVAETVNV